MSISMDGAPLDQILSLVERAVQGDRRLLVQLHRVFQRLACLQEAPAEERRLGEILARLLIGDRQPDLTGLPKDMAEEIRALLRRIR